MWRRLSLALLTVLIGLLVGGPGFAAVLMAPQYTGSEPDDGAELHEPPEEVSVTFSEPLDPSSTLKVEACDDRVDDGEVTVTANEMTVGLKTTPLGHYTVTFHAVGIAGLTGEDTGRFGFELVHGGKPCNGSVGHHHGGGDDVGHSGHDDTDDHAGHNMGDKDHAGHSGGGEADHGTDHASGHTATEDHSAHEDSTGDHDQHAAGQPKTQPKEVRDRVEGIATGQAPFPRLTGPDTTAVLMALGLAGAFGIVGGWILRVSGS